MDENEKIMEDLEKPFEEKLAEQKAKDAEQRGSSNPVTAANASQALQDTMEESKDTINTSANASRVDNSQDASAELFGGAAQ